MGSSARNGPRLSARRTRRTLPVLAAGSTGDDHAVPPPDDGAGAAARDSGRHARTLLSQAPPCLAAFRSRPPGPGG